MGMLLLPWVPNIPCSVGAACCTSFHKPWEISSWSYIQKSRANEDQRLMDSFPSFQEVICFHRLSLSMEKETAPKTTKDVKENTMEINPSMTSEQENTLPMHPAWHLHPQSSLQMMGSLNRHSASSVLSAIVNSFAWRRAVRFARSKKMWTCS